MPLGESKVVPRLIIALLLSFETALARFLRQALPCYHWNAMGWLADNREQLKSEIRSQRTWDKKPSLWRTVLHEFRISVRPTDTPNMDSAKTIHVSIDQIEGEDADSYDCPRSEILG